MESGTEALQKTNMKNVNDKGPVIEIHDAPTTTSKSNRTHKTKYLSKTQLGMYELVRQ